MPEDPKIIDYAGPAPSDGPARRFRWDLVALFWSILSAPPLVLVPALFVIEIGRELWPAADVQVAGALVFLSQAGAFILAWRLVFLARQPGERPLPRTLFFAYLVAGLSLMITVFAFCKQGPW